MIYTDVELAKHIATQAGKLLVDLRENYSGTAQALRDTADAQAQQLIADLLNEHRPDDAVLSEEAVDDQSRLTAKRVWIIDPLDGTWEYGEGRSDWAVHIALAVDGVVSDSAIALPAADQLFATDSPPVLPKFPKNSPKIVVSRTRPPKDIEKVSERLVQKLKELGLPHDLELLEVGSAGAKTAALLTGQAQLYFHDGGLNEWDAAAPFAIALAAGITVKHLDGTDIKYNQSNPKLASVYLAVPEIAHLIEEVCE